MFKVPKQKKERKRGGGERYMADMFYSHFLANEQSSKNKPLKVLAIVIIISVVNVL